MNALEAWDAFYKSQPVAKASVSEKLDVIAAQMNEMQTTVDRLAETIPESQGDAAALETANNTPPEGGMPPQSMEEMLGVGAEETGDEMPEEEVSEDMEMEEDVPQAGAPAGGEDVGGEPMDAATAGGENAGGIEDDGYGDLFGDEDEDEDIFGDGEGVVSPEGGAAASEAGGNTGALMTLKELVSSTDDPAMLSKLFELGQQLAQSGGTTPAQSMESQDVAFAESASVAKADDDPGEAAEEATKEVKEEAPDTTTSEDSVAEAEPEMSLVDQIMSKIAVAIQGILEECLGEGDEEEAAPEEGEETKIDDEDADVHIDAEEGSNVEVESDDSKKGEDEDDAMTEEDKIDRNEEIGGNPFAASLHKSFKDMLKGRIEAHVGIDGQHTRDYVAKADECGDGSIAESDDESIAEAKYPGASHRKYTGEAGTEGSQRAAEWAKWNAHLKNNGTGKGKVAPRDVKMVRKLTSTNKEEEGEAVADTGLDESVSAACKSATAEQNGKHIATVAEVQAVQKSDRPDTIATSNGSLTPPSLEANPVRMTSFRDMMSGKNRE